MKGFGKALVGNFYNPSLKLDDIRCFFNSDRFSGKTQIRMLKSKTVLIRCSSEEDFIQIWAKGSCFVQGHWIRISRWRPNSSQTITTSVSTALPNLPCHLFEKEFLFSLATAVGEPITLDAATTAISRPNLARICIEIDIKKPLPQRIWIKEGGRGFWQHLIYENVPKFCSCCSQLGHTQYECHHEISKGFQKGNNAKTKTAQDPGNKDEKFTDSSAKSALHPGAPMMETIQKVMIEAKHRAAEDNSIRKKNAISWDLIVTEVDNGDVKSRVSEEDCALIQNLVSSPVVSCNIYRTTSSPSLQKDWTAIRKKENMIQTAGCLSNQAWITDSQGIVLISDMQPSIKVNVQFEEQKQTSTKKGKIKNQSKTEIYKKKEKQNARRKVK